VQRVLRGGQSTNPSTAELAAVVDSCPGAWVVVLPNNENVVPVARQLATLRGDRIRVVPTRSALEALAALVEYDASAEVEVNVAAMIAAAERVRTGEVTQAVRNSVAECGVIAAGDWIALTRDGVLTTAPSALDALFVLVDRLLDTPAELVTVVMGADADQRDTKRISQHVGRAHPDVELEIHDGGQPLYPYLVGVE
jgi:dihydroxyacetone kinase-like predicted kinase